MVLFELIVFGGELI